MLRKVTLLSLVGAWILAGMSQHSLRAAPVTQERIQQLEQPSRDSWQNYLTHSRDLAAKDQSSLDAEVLKLGLALPVKAPSGGDFKLPAESGSPWFGSEDAAKLADVILSFQTPSGGWSKHNGYSHGSRQPGMQFTSQNEPGSSAHYVATFDNRATTEELYFLAGVWRATGREDCKTAVLRGLDFIFSAQFPNGGWPQVYPLEGGYHDDITFNDDAMTRVLELLHAVKSGEADFAMVDDARRKQAADALAKGLDCVFFLQCKIDGKPAGWCAQYDAISMQPAAARKMEPVSISGIESAQLLKFLMTIPNPSPEMVASIEGGLSWLESAKVTNLSKTKVDGKTVYVVTPDSGEIYWARFYDLQTGKAIFPGRNGEIYPTYEAMISENRGGYDYLSTRPGSIIGNGQKKWRKMLAKETKR